jgi:pyruvate/2-oxoglutarate dehydrogenase complex dihydrolipoamide acyltransferase (E2) component
VDFSKFGEIEEVAMTRLMQVGAANLHRSWLNVPHVTQFDSADITDLEAFRVAQKAVAEKAGVKLTVLPLLLKGLRPPAQGAAGLQQFAGAERQGDHPQEVRAYRLRRRYAGRPAGAGDQERRSEEPAAACG